MPYIIPEERPKFIPHINVLCNMISDKGEANYVITKIVDNLYGYGGYERISEGVSLLGDVKDEFRRRRLHPHEDRKCAENGDVFE